MLKWHPDWIPISKSSCCVNGASSPEWLCRPPKLKFVHSYMKLYLSFVDYCTYPPPCPTVLKTWSKQESSLLSIFLSNDTFFLLKLNIILFCLCERKKRIPLYTKTQNINYRIPLKHFHLLFRAPLRDVRETISSLRQQKPWQTLNTCPW